MGGVCRIAIWWACGREGARVLMLLRGERGIEGGA